MNEDTTSPIKRALISVSDKTGIVEFAGAIKKHGVQILSTGGTSQMLRKAGIKVIDVSDYTGFPEMMDGRIKTLHPKIHGGILGRRGSDHAVMKKNRIPPIDLVVVNLYPFAATVASSECTLEEAIENIDIGGPAMVRAAAKNYRHVTVVVSTQDYSTIVEELEHLEGHTSLKTRFELAVRAYEHTAAYDGMIANYFGCLTEVGSKDFPNTFNFQFKKAQDLRYGENPHQNAAFYREINPSEATTGAAEQLQGKALSYNNLADADAALECVKSFEEPACVIVKHANPCGVAVAKNLLNAYDSAFQTDIESAFGGIIAFNRELDKETATRIIEQQFVEVIVAPEISREAIAVVSAKKNVRLLRTGTWSVPKPALDFKKIHGGLLIQDRDHGFVSKDSLSVATKRKPSDTEWDDLLFAWRVAKFVKSNAIIYAAKQRTIGVGAGQMSRINSARIGAIKAEQARLSIKGAVMASDAFFPFRDGIDNAAELGVVAVIQPGGSIRDEEVIAAADDAGMSMVFTGVRHFRH